MDVFQQLTYQEQCDLRHAAQSGDISARNALVESVMPLAIKTAVAFNCRNREFPLDDRKQVAALALHAAVAGWDPDRGRLTSYAVATMRRKLVNYLLGDIPMIYVPDEWSAEERRRFRVGRLNTTCRPGCLSRHGNQRDLDLHDKSTSATAATELTELQRATREAVRRLPTRQRLLMRMILAGQSRKSIAKEWGVTASRIWQLYHNAIERLRRNKKLAELAN